MKLTHILMGLMALALPAAATAQVVTSPTQIADPDGDGFIKLVNMAAKVTPPVKKNTTVAVCTEVAPFTYAVKGTPCPVVTPPVITPPVVTPPPITANAAIAKGESFIQTDTATFGFNSDGGLGTLNGAPSGFRTDVASGLLRVSVFVPPLGDAILEGRAIEGFGVVINGVTYANLKLAGFSQIPGGFTSPFEWRGAVAGIGFVNVAAPIGSELTQDIALTNTTAKPVVVTYFRSVDPDQSSDKPGGTRNFSTVNRVIAAGSVEAGLYGGGAYFMATDEPGARVAFTTYNKPAVIGTTLAVGASRTADDTLQLVFAPMLIEPGQSRTLRFRQGVRP